MLKIVVVIFYKCISSPPCFAPAGKHRNDIANIAKSACHVILSIQYRGGT